MRKFLFIITSLLILGLCACNSKTNICAYEKCYNKSAYGSIYCDEHRSHMIKNIVTENTTGVIEETTIEATTLETTTASQYTLKTVHEESLPTYTYWDKNDQRVDGTFYMREILVTGDIDKFHMLKEAEKIEREKGSVETRIKFYNYYDSNASIQSKDNLLADIILRNGDLLIDDPYEPEPKYISKGQFVYGDN